MINSCVLLISFVVAFCDSVERYSPESSRYAPVYRSQWRSYDEAPSSLHPPARLAYKLEPLENYRSLDSELRAPPVPLSSRSNGSKDPVVPEYRPKIAPQPTTRHNYYQHQSQEPGDVIYNPTEFTETRSMESRRPYEAQQSAAGIAYPSVKIGSRPRTHHSRQPFPHDDGRGELANEEEYVAYRERHRPVLEAVQPYDSTGERESLTERVSFYPVHDNYNRPRKLPLAYEQRREPSSYRPRSDPDQFVQYRPVESHLVGSPSHSRIEEYLPQPSRPAPSRVEGRRPFVIAPAPEHEYEDEPIYQGASRSDDNSEELIYVDTKPKGQPRPKLEYVRQYKQEVPLDPQRQSYVKTMTSTVRPVHIPHSLLNSKPKLTRIYISDSKEPHKEQPVPNAEPEVKPDYVIKEVAKSEFQPKSKSSSKAELAGEAYYKSFRPALTTDQLAPVYIAQENFRDINSVADSKPTDDGSASAPKPFVTEHKKIVEAGTPERTKQDHPLTGHHSPQSSALIHHNKHETREPVEVEKKLAPVYIPGPGDDNSKHDRHPQEVDASGSTKEKERFASVHENGAQSNDVQNAQPIKVVIGSSRVVKYPTYQHSTQPSTKAPLPVSPQLVQRPLPKSLNSPSRSTNDGTAKIALIYATQAEE